MGTGVRLTIGPEAKTKTSTLVGKGIYPIPVAARLSKVSERKIRYWLKRLESEDAREGKRLWQGEHQPIDSKIVLSFLDLQEVRFVERFLLLGVSWKVLRAAHEVARKRYKTEYPFCTRSFATDGKHIIEELKSSANEIEYEEIAKTQKIFASVVRPFVKDVDFSADKRLLRWWPRLHWFRWLIERAPNYDLVCIAGDLLDMFKSETRMEQAREVTKLIRQLADLVPVAVCSGNHDNAGRLVSHDRAPVYEWFIDLGSHPNIITDGTRKLENLIVTAIPYHCSWQEKSIWLDRGSTIRRQTGIPWIVLHHVPAKTGLGVSGEEVEASEILAAYRH